MTGRPAGESVKLPVNDAPYTMVLYDSPATGRRVRCRIVPEIARVPFELCTPIRAFPAYRGRRSHQGKYWFSRSESHVGFESRFEMTALMVLDFRGDATAVSSNPFWLLWPKGFSPTRHAPDFFVRRRDGSALVVDVKPAERISDKDRVQHARTRAVCRELGWDYEEFTTIETAVDRNLRLLSGYHHRRFALPVEARAAITARLRGAGEHGIRLAQLIETACADTGIPADRAICGVYHMVWSGEVQTDLAHPLTWSSAVRA